MSAEKTQRRCPWAGSTPAMQRYHDTVWGVPVFDDRTLFEFLTLESAQAGLSWSSILNRQEGYRAAFAGFDPGSVARFTPEDIDRLCADTRIIRNRLKIESAVHNAQFFLDLAEEGISFSAWFWRFTDGRTIQNAWKTAKDVPPCTPLSDRISREMKKQGLRFVGSTVVYSFMQAVGMVNDHLTTCFRYEQIRAISEKH